MESTNTHNVVPTKDVIGVSVMNHEKEDLGKVEEIMIDKISGRVAYVVLESGGFLGMGGKYFAIPWQALKYNESEDCFMLNVDKEKLKNAPGFDKDHWPDMADRQWGQTVSQYYGTRNYWE